jgi:hypothetical protein
MNDEEFHTSETAVHGCVEQRVRSTEVTLASDQQITGILNAVNFTA